PSYFGVINRGQFTFNKSIDVLSIIVLGGIGSVSVIIVAAIAVGIIIVYLQQHGAVGMVVCPLEWILIMIFSPAGLMGNIEFSLRHLFKRPQDVPGSIENMEQEKGI